MSIHDWEPDIEWFERAGDDLVPKIKHFELYTGDIEQDYSVYYEANNNRHVVMRVLGESATGPVVKPYIYTSGEVVTRQSGVFIGSVHPEESKLTSPFLRTKHKPLILPADQPTDKGYYLPTPRHSLHIILPVIPQRHRKHGKRKR